MCLVGCYTIPRHFAEEYEEIIIYDPGPTEPPVYDPPILIPGPPVFYPPAPDPNPEPKLRQPEKTKDRNGYENQIRDPLRGHGNREIEKSRKTGENR